MHREGMHTQIHAIYSGPYGHELSWSLNGTPIKSTSPYSMEFDGLNAVLIITKDSDEVYGEYTLRLKGTSTFDKFVFLPCENLNVLFMLVCS